jgi:hypothetical protein
MTLLTGMSGARSPYLKPDRLADVLAAIQVMAVSDQYRRPLKQWTYYLSGKKAPKSQSQPEPDSDFDSDSDSDFESDSEPASESDAESAVERWRIVFDQHPEFFRLSPGKRDFYALVLRRGLPRRFHVDKRDLISPAELAQMPPEQRKKQITRAPIPTSEIKVLLDMALALHRAATERQAAKWAKVQMVIPLVSSLIGGVVVAASSRQPATGSKRTSLPDRPVALRST